MNMLRERGLDSTKRSSDLILRGADRSISLPADLCWLELIWCKNVWCKN
jgi:hypothetical protein